MSAEFIAHVPFKTNHTSPLRFILSHISRHPVVGVLMILGGFSNAAFAAAVPYFIGVAFNAVIAGNQQDVIIHATLGVVISQFMRGCLQLMRNFCAPYWHVCIVMQSNSSQQLNCSGSSFSFSGTKASVK